MVVVKTDRTFVYGRFFVAGPRRAPRRPFSPAGAVPAPDIAIEILREPSATELLGKLYHKTAYGQWEPVDPGSVESYSWYQAFVKAPRTVRFAMEGSPGHWEVLNFRRQSDENGFYVAAGLRYAG